MSVFPKPSWSVASRQSRILLVAFGLALAVPAAMSGQQRMDAQAAAAMAQSQRVATDLTALQADRSTAEHALISKWEAVLDPNQYNVRNELAAIVSRTPDWQLYGASKAGDFDTMVGILTGTKSAGTAINGASSGVSRYFGGVLGSGTDSLVYTPFPPCRIVDTRGVGARTGLMPANTTRSFDLTTDGYAKGQGGSTSGCPGLPSFSHFGWAANITVTGYGDNGWLAIFPFGGAEPFVSSVNYASGIWSVANGLNLTGCLGCDDDITIRAANASTHVVIDVVGFYHAAISTPAAVTRLIGPVTSRLPGTVGFHSGGACPDGTVLVGGEVDHDILLNMAIGEETGETTTWTALMINSSLSASDVRVYSRCLETPVAVF